MASETAGTERTSDASLARLARLIEPGSLLEATPECLVVARADGRIIFANHHVEALTGFAAEDLVGQQVDLLITDDLLSGDPGTRVETLCRRREGNSIPVEVHLGTIDGPERLLVVTLRDVTELHAGREAQQEAETRFRLRVEQSPAITYTWTWENGEYFVPYVSPQIEAILGYTPTEWMADAEAWYDWVHPDDLEMQRAEVERCEASGESFSLEYRMVRKDGGIIWVSEAWAVVDDEGEGRRAFQGIVMDITERREAEEALRERSERLSSVVETQRDVAAADLDLTTVMHLICERTQEVTRAASATILLFEDGSFVHMAATGFMTERVGQTVPLVGTLTGWVYENGRSTICIDTLTDERVGPLAPTRGIRSMAVVPLRHGEETIGQLQVLSDVPDSFTDEDVSTLELLSVVLSAAMSHAAEFEAKRDQIEALALFETVYEGAPIGVALISSEGRVIESNPALQEMLGYTSDELASMTISDYTHPDDIENDIELFSDLMAGSRESYRLEKRYLRSDGETVWGQDTASLHRDVDGKPKFAILMMENITERKLADERVAFMAYHDKLTGLPNRTLFEEMLENALARAQRHGLAVGVLFLDLDNFKLVNDSLGHHAGDQLLMQLADRLRVCTRETDLVARQGGDEFLLLLSDLERGTSALSGTDAAVLVAEMVANRVRDALSEPFDLNGIEFYASASMGISLYPQDANDATELLKNADTAMYQSKKTDPGNYVVYSGTTDDPVRRLSVSSRLRQAVADENWVLHYQPIVDLSDGAVHSVEALVRWRQPNGGLVPPGEFIPLAEEMGLIEAIGDWVFDELARQHAEWTEQGVNVAISYNLSPRQMWTADLAEKLLAKLAMYDVDPHDITIEITESMAMADPDRTQRLLTELHSWGFTLAIDDFGTGYSSLARLKHMPVDVLKIDQAFIRNVEYDRDLAGMVRAMIQLAQSLGMIPLAEGIETYGEYEFLRANGCRLAQGFHFAYPVPAAEIPALVRRVGGLVEQPPSLG
jgi:diguanylate cyclase (GGDEF)-like protein/PAS domain S-box-containing protein